MRRQLLRAVAGLAAARALPVPAQSVPVNSGAQAGAQAGVRRLPRLVLAGPHASVSNPFHRMLETGALDDLAEVVELRLWKDPDQLRALALDPKTQAHFVAMPTNVAANLYNRGVRLQLLDVSTWGVLWMISREAGLRTLADFRGKEILMPFRADMPDIVFQVLAQRQGLDVRRDVALRYVGTPLDAMQLLVTRRADHALLAEPAASVALRKTRSFPLSTIAPELHRSVDLQAEWGRVLGRAPRIPQAGVVALGAVLDRPEVIRRVQQRYAAALRWCERQPDECGRLVARRSEMLTPEGVADAIRVDNTGFVEASAARAELEFFFGVLAERQPGLVGGRLPDAGFYFDAGA